MVHRHFLRINRTEDVADFSRGESIYFSLCVVTHLLCSVPFH